MGAAYGYGAGADRRSARTETIGANLLASPRDFANAVWQTGGAGATVTSNVAAGTDGATLADRLADSSAAVTARRQQPVAVTSGATYQATLSFKAETGAFAALEIVEGTRRLVLNPATGAFIPTGLHSATVIDRGGGWWTATVRFAASSATATFRVYPAYAATLTQTGDVAATGNTIVDNAGLHLVS